MSALPYMRLYVADYLADTSHLSTLEHGAYLLLIMNYWQRGEALPCGDAQLARIARVSAKEWSAIKPALAELFEDDGTCWRHGRIEQELAKVTTEKKHKSNAGKASAATKAQQKINRCSTGVEHVPNDTDTDTEERRMMLDSEGAQDVSRVSENPSTDQWPEIERLLRDAAGWMHEPHPNLAVIGPVAAAMAGGVDLHMDILPAARAHGPTLRSRTSWNYILQAAITARDARLQAASDAAKVVNLPHPQRPSHVKPSRSNIGAILNAGSD